jgi:hypothetical protein
MSDIYDRPRQIIEYCLKPLNLDTASPDYQETHRRLEHVLKTFQLASRSSRPIPVDFSNMPTITINEFAHGDAA